jgi:tetratricopeptide (TPR) repeat protein
MAGTLVALPPGAEVGSRRMPGPVDAVMLDEYERMNAHLWQVFGLSQSKRVVYPLVRQQLGLLTAGLERASTGEAHRRLCILVGDLFQLAGEIFFDGNRYLDAAHCYTLAASAAKEATAFDLWACALTRHAFIGLYERRYNDAGPMLGVAAQVARRGDSHLSTRHWVAAVQAEAFAGLGDLDACNRALDAAEEVHGLNGRVHNGGWLRFDGSRLAEQRGTCYTELGRHDLAKAALTEAVRQALTPRRSGGVLTDLALLGVYRRDLDQALYHGGTALELAEQTGSGYVARKLQGLRTKLAPFGGDSRVSDFSDRVSQLAGIAG